MNVLTYSNTSTFENCRKKYQYQYVKALRPVMRPLYFSMGAAIHLALEHHYLGWKSDDEIIAEIEKYFYENQPSIDDRQTLEKWNEERSLAIEMYRHYREEYPRESFEVVYVEKQFNVPIVNPETGASSRNFRFAGKVDLLARENGLYWIVEHKTTGTLNNIYKKKLSLDGQCIAYIEALERELDIKIQGVIYNILLKAVPHKPKILNNGQLSTDKRQCTTVKLFLQAIKENLLSADDYSDYLYWLESNRKEYFYREYLVFPRESIEEWRSELWDIQKNIREAELKDQYYKNTSQCTTRGICSFFDICTAMDKEAVIEMSYVPKEAMNEELASSF